MTAIAPVLIASDGKRVPVSAAPGAEGFQVYDIPAGSWKIRFSVPIRDIAGFWHPAAWYPEMRFAWQIAFTAGAQRDFPYVAFFSDAHRNRFSAGLSELVAESAFFGKLSQADGTYELEFSIKSPRAFQLFVDCREDLPWPECLNAYRKIAHPAPLPDYPAGAWDPVYCTWYAFHAAMTQDAVEANARAAADLGFGTLILDDGWSYDEAKRVCASAKRWYKDIGNWTVSKAKFPDMKGHVRRVQAMGMKYLFWVAPTLIGSDSREFHELRHVTRCDYKAGFVEDSCWKLDTRDEASVAKVFAKLDALMRDYGLDGLKVDFIDDIRPDREPGMAESVYDFVRRLRDLVTAVKPDALLEYRQHYNTPQMLDMATQFRAGDVPFDYLSNFNRIAHIRITVGDRVPVHADPVYWSAVETPENIARHLVASLAGVPMASMDMTKLTPTETAIFRHYIGFYRAHREIYRRGHWEVLFRGTLASVICGEFSGERIAIAADPADAAKIAARGEAGTHLLNLSPERIPAPAAKAVYDGQGILCSDKVIPVGGRAEF